MRLKARSSRLTFAFSCRLQATSSEFQLALSSAACVWAVPSSSRALKVAATDTAVEPKVQQLHPTRARCMPPAHERPQERQQPSSVTRTTRIQLPATSAACAYTARIASRSQSPGASSPALLAGAGGAQVVAQHAAKACLKQSNYRSSTIPRTPRWSCCGVLMGSTCAEQAQCAEVKVRTLSPIPPQCIAACRLTLRRTSWRLPASSISISILLVRRFGVGSRAHTR